ncbi:MAG: hypothetical protein IPM25_00280 [Chloracidobacterium sp.]|nr:hypothetical protein [Chloracidobacterium sp.]
MIKRMVAFSCLCLLVLNLSGSTVALNGDVNKARSASADLVAMLPASDGVVTLDVKRFFSGRFARILPRTSPQWTRSFPRSIR